MTWILVGWLFSGFLGWAWMNYSIHRRSGSSGDESSYKWMVLLLAPLSGPYLILQNIAWSWNRKMFYWGLRLR